MFQGHLLPLSSGELKVQAAFTSTCQNKVYFIMTAGKSSKPPKIMNVTWCESRRLYHCVFQINKWSDVEWSDVKWSDVEWSDVEWTYVIYVKWFYFEVKWVTVMFLGIKVLCTLVWPYTEGNWLYCDYFIWCVSGTLVVLTCTVVVWNCFVMCVCVCVCVCVCLCVCVCVCVYGCGFCNVWVFW